MSAQEAPKLACPNCGEPLIAAGGRGRYSRDGNYIEHRDGCRCHWCNWMWFDDIDPVLCECGARVRVVCDGEHANAEVTP